jgi:hypothetical protein
MESLIIRVYAVVMRIGEITYAKMGILNQRRRFRYG